MLLVMQTDKPVIVIVPDAKGVEALANIADVTAVLVEPTQPVPSEAVAATVLVVGPAEQQHEVDAALQQIKQLPHLRLLQTLGQGIEQWDGLLPPGLKLSTARGAHGGSTAELVLATLLSLVRKLPLYSDQQRRHQWEGHQARTLLNMRVLVYGASDLGQNVLNRLLPFGAQVTMVGTHSRDAIVDTTTASTLLSTTDIVILALSLTQETRAMVNAEFLAALPNGAIVINAGRGGLIDQPALLAELRTGRLEAALDVTAPEPLPTDSPLWDTPGLLLTPHVGGNTLGADERAWHVASEQIRAYLHGNKS